MDEYNGAVVTGSIRSIRSLAGGVARELFPTTAEIDASHGAEAWRPDEPSDYCPRCGASVGPGEVTQTGCAFCTDKPIVWQRLVRLGLYADPLDERIRDMKFHGDWRTAGRFGRLLAERVGEPFEAKRIIVCPVPMFWTRRWLRGYNQAALVARALGRARGWPLIEVLQRTKPTPPQTSVPASKRAANVRGSFVVVEVDLSGYEVVLVDDVKTTGATLSACTRLLRKAGARSVTVAVAAVADPKHLEFTAI